jgi:hypothetical protein
MLDDRPALRSDPGQPAAMSSRTIRTAKYSSNTITSMRPRSALVLVSEPQHGVGGAHLVERSLELLGGITSDHAHDEVPILVAEPWITRTATTAALGEQLFPLVHTKHLAGMVTDDRCLVTGRAAAHLPWLSDPTLRWSGRWSGFWSGCTFKIHAMATDGQPEAR